MANPFTYLATGTASDLVPICSNSARTRIVSYDIYNSGTAPAYVNFYWGNNQFGGGDANGFSGGRDFPTVGTDSPDWNVAVPAGQRAFLLVDSQNGIFMQGSHLFMSITTTVTAGGPPVGDPVFSGSVTPGTVLVNVAFRQ